MPSYATPSDLLLAVAFVIGTVFALGSLLYLTLFLLAATNKLVALLHALDLGSEFDYDPGTGTPPPCSALVVDNLSESKSEAGSEG